LRPEAPSIAFHAGDGCPRRSIGRRLPARSRRSVRRSFPADRARRRAACRRCRRWTPRIGASWTWPAPQMSSASPPHDVDDPAAAVEADLLVSADVAAREAAARGHARRARDPALRGPRHAARLRIRGRHRRGRRPHACRGDRIPARRGAWGSCTLRRAGARPDPPRTQLTEDRPPVSPYLLLAILATVGAHELLLVAEPRPCAGKPGRSRGGVRRRGSSTAAAGCSTG
jgi:hypothetical protein